MNFENPNYDTVMDPSMQPMQAMDASGAASGEDESPTLAFLRAKKPTAGGLNAESNHSAQSFGKPEAELGMPEEFGGDDMMNFNLLANQQALGDDESSINPLDAFDPEHDLLLTGDDADLVDFALRSDSSNNQSIATISTNSFASGAALSLGDAGLHEHDEELLRKKEQLRKETMESLNKSMSSLNDAFERLTASMDRTNKTREMLKHFEQQSNPLDDLRKNAALTGIAPTPSITGVAVGGSRRRRTLTRSGSNSSLNSLGSKGSIGSNKSIGSNRGRKSREKTSRKLKRNVKSDLRSDLRNDLTRSRSSSRSSLGRLPRTDSNPSRSGLPDHITITGI